LRRALGLPETATLGITVASFTPIKDHASLLRAAAPLLTSNSESLQLVFIGDGALRGAIEQQIATLGIGHKVRLAGQQDAVSRWLQAADFFVLPSQLEGMSCAIQEAMACGLPVIARRTGGNPELIEDGVTGLLCPPGAPDGLGAALASLSHSPALRRRLGTAARQRAEATFSLPAMVDAYAALYRRTALAA
jgi:glycosyltransferase involved in cell wall biosynthesis